MTTATSRPARAPISGLVVEPVACAAAHRNSAVSSPSRPTASTANSTRLTAPASAATSRRASSSPRSERAVRAIQKIIIVTNATAMIDSDPPIISWASNDRPRGP